MGGQEFDPSIHEEWWWLRKDPPGVLTLSPLIESGTVNVANNSDAITFSATQSTDLDGYFFKTADIADVFRISAHTAGSASATLDAVYTGATNSAVSYKLYKLEYVLASDVLRVLSPMRVYQDSRRKVHGMSLAQLEEWWPLNNIQSGVPRAFAPITESKVRFSHYGGTTSTSLIRLEYDYLYKPAALTDSGTEEPVLPLQNRAILSDLGLFYLYLDKNDSRVEGIGNMAKAKLKAMQKENIHRWASFGYETGHIAPRQRDFVGGREGPLRTQTGLIIG